MLQWCHRKEEAYLTHEKALEHRLALTKVRKYKKQDRIVKEIDLCEY